MSDFNVALLIIVIIVVLAVFAVNVYVLVNYSHPDDNNQAYFPKFVVVLGLSVAQLSILMLPADVANRAACQRSIVAGACKLTLPMRELWYAIYIIDVVLAFFVIPFAMFYYEGDQDKTWPQRAAGALMWVAVIVVIVGLILGILYGLVGYVDFPTRRLVSAMVPMTGSLQAFGKLSATSPCVVTVAGVGETKCAGWTAGLGSATNWTQRVSFPVYVIALATIVGSCLFSVFGGIGIAALPLECIFAFLARPQAVLTRAQYVREAMELGKRAREIRDVAEALKTEERGGNKGRTWKRNVRKLETELYNLEEDKRMLEEVYPQGEEADISWATTVLSYLIKLIFGIFGLIISIAWVLHIIIYMLVQPALSPFLNQVFIKLDDAFGLFGTAAFAFFCFYLLIATIAGEMIFGLNFLIVTIHPMKWNGTFMSSFLFNVALILLSSISVIQFCAAAFAKYANQTEVQRIFGQQLTALRGIKYLFKYNVFQYCFIILAIVTLMYYMSFGWAKKPKANKYMKAVLAAKNKNKGAPTAS